jgi:hypothetical protein
MALTKSRNLSPYMRINAYSPIIDIQVAGVKNELKRDGSQTAPLLLRA